MLSATAYFTCPIERLTSADEDEFFAGIRLANNTFKTTSPGRLNDVAAAIVRLAVRHKLISPTILDVAVSSGVTTAELASAMASRGLKATIVATDIAIDATIYSIWPGVKVLADRNGFVLQYEIFGKGVRAWNRRLDSITGYFIVTALLRRLVGKAKKLPVMDVKLTSRLAESSLPQSVTFVQDDLLVRNESFNNGFDIVRAANILNCGYFTTQQIKTIVANLKGYVVKPGGSIVVARTEADDTNHATMFEASASGFEVVERIGRGSEIEPLVCD